MRPREEILEAVVAAAQAWQDPAYPSRAEATARTLSAPNRFTEEAIAFAVNQQMSVLTHGSLAAWVGRRAASVPCTVGVLNAGNIPLVGLQDLLAVVLMGHQYVGTVSSKSPFLLPAFVEEITRFVPDLPARFVPLDALWAEADALIATGTDETRAWAEQQSEAHGLPSSRRLVRGHRFAAAVIDGQERPEEREGLAEDTLLHEGHGCRNVAVIWAPRGLSPDPYLEAFAVFRSVFPVHEQTPGSLRMQRAFLEAVDQPHAYGEGLEFLLSKGMPEVQRPGHIRWAEYDTLAVVDAWLAEQAEALQLVVARPQLAARLTTDVLFLPPGEAQRPPLDWRPDGTDTIAFLATL